AEMEQEKRDVVVGIVETHGRYETGAQLLGLQLLPRRKVSYRGIEVDEFDIDAALNRRPQVLLVDELAHTNVEGSRHPKRWQDVEQTWAITDQLLVAVSPSPYSARLVRAARRMAGSLHARWFAVYVEPRTAAALPKAAAARLSQNLALAEQLGAEVITLAADN